MIMLVGNMGIVVMARYLYIPLCICVTRDYLPLLTICQIPLNTPRNVTEMEIKNWTGPLGGQIPLFHQQDYFPGFNFDFYGWRHRPPNIFVFFFNINKSLLNQKELRHPQFKYIHTLFSLPFPLQHPPLSSLSQPNVDNQQPPNNKQRPPHRQGGKNEPVVFGASIALHV